ncbi:MAG: serine/threonine-protein kinase [Pseudomonadota bacterium]
MPRDSEREDMDDRGWKRAQEFFEELVDLEPSEQQARLAAAGHDSKLCERVAAMLADDAGLDADVVHERAMAGLEPSLAGHRVGPYRVLRQLGQGGMGLVYLAERDGDDTPPQVAIKLLRRGLDPRRFRMERSVLERLHHPHIARLIDGGSLEDGRPYVVMEYIDGQPIDVYCDGADLGLEARIRLVLDLCAAVEHAHRNLVIHRDLKPANILIDPSGTLKLLDFGIAKLMEPDLVTTRTGERRLTPAYASPEQIQGQPVSTVSDVYSLGVLLYELLCGCRPFAALEKRPRAFERAVLDREPRKPSQASRASARPWARALRGDLDTIILKALRAEPSRRYSSVQALATDLDRQLRGHPIRARPAGPLLRLGKFVGRHRVATTTVLVAVAVAMVQQQRVLRERDVAAQQRDQARLERDLAQRERDAAAANPFYMIDLFSAAATDDEPVPTRELVDQGVREMSEQFADDPVVHAQLAANMGSLYQAMGRYQSAARLYGEALALERQLNGDDSPVVADALLRLSRLHFYKGLYDEAEPLAREALAIFDQTRTADDAARASALDLLGSIQRYRGSTAEAEQLLREGLRLRRDSLGDQHGDTGTSFNNLAGLFKDQGRYDESIALYEQAVAAFAAGRGESHPDLIMGLNNLAQALHGAGRLDAAERSYRDALARHREFLGEAQPSIADILENLGVLLMELGELDEARPLLEQALASRHEWLGEGHPRTGNTYSNLGRLLLLSGDEAASRQHLEAAQRIFMASLGESHWRTAAETARLAELAEVPGDSISTGRSDAENGRQD